MFYSVLGSQQNGAESTESPHKPAVPYPIILPTTNYCPKPEWYNC